MKDKKQDKSKKFSLYILLILIVIAVFFRFYNFPIRFGLGDETVRDAVVGLEGARELQMPLVGAFSSAGPFTFGPWFYYQLILFSIFVHSVYASWIYLGIASVLCVVVLYKIGELVVGRHFGLLLGFLGALSPALIIAGIHLTTQNLTNIYALLSLLLFLKLALQKRSLWWSFVFGIVLGIGVNLHFQMAGLLVMPLILLIYKRKTFLSDFLILVLGILLTYLPLLFFDLNNHWFTVRNMLYYLQYGKNAIYVPNRWLFYLRDFWPTYWADVIGVSYPIALTIISSFIIITLRLIWKKCLPRFLLLSLLVFGFNFILLRFYWGPRFFGYLNFLRPFVFLFTGYTLLFLLQMRFGRYLFSIIVVLLTISILPKSFDRLSIDSFSLSMEKRIQQLEQAYPFKKFTVYDCRKNALAIYPAISKSIVFLLDRDNKLAQEGMRIGIKNPACSYPDFEPFLKEEKVYPEISDTGIIDFSKTSDVSLIRAGWNKLSFKSIYEETARWWFVEQP